MKIIYTKTVKLYLWELVETLYLKNYFGFKDSARKYVLALVDEMENTIHLKHKRQAPPYFSRYGKALLYVSYPRRKYTTWYFFFTQHIHATYIIRYVTNNHVAGHLLE
ncbi:MAG: hypothetical protein LUD74_07850 [Tannerellaceae bacterium]|nr:hypothetical protein [Tannerellaceae bacterium]